MMPIPTIVGWKNVSIYSNNNLYSFTLLLMIDDRINWLRAKARYDRWKEELQIVENEMKWTLLWFSYHERNWEKRSEDAGTKGLEGHRCYAEKQAIVWRMIRNHFEKDWEKVGK
jgi:hypothetical protein